MAGHGLTALVGYLLQAERSLPVSGLVFLWSELWVPGLAVGVALLAAGIPALSAYWVDVAQLLNARD